MSDKAIERVQAAIAAIARGEIVILVDDEDRENEGDLVMAAEKVPPEAINFMATHGRGLICLSVSGKRLDELQVPMMVTNNSSPFGTAFAVSIEARAGVTTGISAADRAQTIRVAIDPRTTPQDLVMPGHIFPLRAKDGGVLVRTGQTEGSVDLARMAGLHPSGVICEIMNPDGSMSRMPELEVFAKEHNMVIVSVADMIHYRLRRESLIELVEESALPTDYPGDWRVRVFRSLVDGSTHMGILCGTPTLDQPTLVRVQHRSDTFEVFLRAQGDAIEHLRGSMRAISEAGCGAIVYLDRPERSALQVVRKHLKQEEQQAEDVNQPRGALRDLGIGAQVLAAMGVGKISLLTNRPKRIVGLEGYGLEVVDQVPIPGVGGGDNEE
jgi:3,4-dihydroxy 2-butanone 4-phosphate synthase / GTP cyclohydrolase II